MKKQMRNGIEWIILEGNDFFQAIGYAHVEAWGYACVEAFGSTYILATDDAHVKALENAHVVACGSAYIEARGYSHVLAYESCQVVAWDFSSVVRLSEDSEIKKGSNATVINPIYPKNINKWAKMKGLSIHKNLIHLYKVVKLDGTDFYSGKINYLKEAVALDWDKNYKSECGAGLHLADSPEGAKNFLSDRNDYLSIEVSANINDCKCFPGLPRYPMKLRAKACKFVRIIEKVENGKIVELMP